MRNFMRNSVNWLNIGMDKYMPDSLVFAILLSVITFVMGLVLTNNGPLQMLQHWGTGYWGFLSFGMQMVLALTTGFVVATAPAGKNALRKLATIPKSSPSAIVFLAIVVGFIAWFNWAVGLVAAAFLAREIANNLKKVDFKLLIAVAYCQSITVGIFGPSGPEFLIIATPGNFMEKHLGALFPYSTTIFHPALLTAIVVSFFIVCPFIYYMVHPDDKDTMVLDKHIKEKFMEQDNLAIEAINSAKNKSDMSPAEWLDNSPILNYIFAIAGFAFIGYWFYTKGFSMSLDMMNFIVLMCGILLHKTPVSLNVAFEEGVRNSFGIVLQFPIYAGIQGMMGSSGLVEVVANFFASISTASTFVHWTYVSGAILNIFIPSSGGLFMVAGPAMAKAGAMLHVPGNETIIAFTAGETLSNIIQPFWAIALLGVAGLKMKDIMGQCILVFIVTSIIFNICFILLFK